MCPPDDRPPSARPAPTAPAEEPPPQEHLRAEQFDLLMQEIVPQVRALSPTLPDVQVLRIAAQLAEDRLREGGTLALGLVDLREIEREQPGDAAPSAGAADHSRPENDEPRRG